MGAAAQCQPSSSRLVVGGAGWSIQFDGENDWALMKSAFRGMNEPSHTFEAWVHVRSKKDANTGRPIVTKQRKGTILNQVSLLDGMAEYSILYNGGQLWTTGPTLDTTSSNFDQFDTYKDPYHYALVAEAVPGGQRFTMYVNGSFRSAKILAPPATSKMPSPWLLGAEYKMQVSDLIKGRFFGGTLDALRVWDEARTQAQIQRYMHEPASGPALQTNVDFDEGEGYDAAGLSEGIRTEDFMS
jgi:hypothetical protein